MVNAKHFTYTIYAKQQPEPLVGDEHWPDGSVGITFKPTPNLKYKELVDLIDELIQVSQEMRRSK